MQFSFQGGGQAGDSARLSKQGGQAGISSSARGGIRVHKEGSLRVRKGRSRQALCAELHRGTTESKEGTSHHPLREQSAKKEETAHPLCL
jgi:hypothetical protein